MRIKWYERQGYPTPFDLLVLMLHFLHPFHVVLLWRPRQERVPATFLVKITLAKQKEIRKKVKI